MWLPLQIKQKWGFFRRLRIARYIPYSKSEYGNYEEGVSSFLLIVVKNSDLEWLKRARDLLQKEAHLSDLNLNIEIVV